ncbi:hypothetical protein NE558_10065 [Anaerotignum propionicum]|nr:hypothetical protein [Anaerotignum propionicum]
MYLILIRINCSIFVNEESFLTHSMSYLFNKINSTTNEEITIFDMTKFMSYGFHVLFKIQSRIHKDVVKTIIFYNESLYSTRHIHISYAKF